MEEQYALAAAAKTAQDSLYSQEIHFLLPFQSFQESPRLQVSTDAQSPAAGTVSCWATPTPNISLSNLHILKIKSFIDNMNV